MGAFRPPKSSFDPLDLEIMERALEFAWNMFKDRWPFRDPSGDDEVRTALSEKLIAIASVQGLSDPETLVGHLVDTAGPPR